VARKLTRNQARCLAHINEVGEATIQETADATELTYGAAQQALYRLADLGQVFKERLNDGTKKIVYSKLVLENPDSDDPLERAFAAPAAEGHE
jgi:DNA-binding MarR family transcriptional regulator